MVGSAEVVIVGKSPALLRQVTVAKRHAAARAPILICGERGTNKELFARLIHQEGSRGGHWYSIHCASLVGDRDGAELFGRARSPSGPANGALRGAFELAGGGTLFLDGIHEMPIHLQPKLLQAIRDGRIRPAGSARERCVDVQVIAATSEDLVQVVEDGLFREDLHARLDWGRIELPPLRARGDDIELLAEHYLSGGKELRGLHKRLTQEGARLLYQYSWPGNTDELHKVLYLAAMAGDGPRIRCQDLMSALDQASFDPGQIPRSAVHQVAASSSLASRPPSRDRERPLHTHLSVESAQQPRFENRDHPSATAVLSCPNCGRAEGLSDHEFCPATWCGQPLRGVGG